MEATSRTTVMTPLESSPHHIFYTPPEKLVVNERAWTEYGVATQDGKLIDVLISQLVREGPFVAVAQLGPDIYIENPVAVNDTLPGVEVFGWEKGSPRIETNLESPVVVLGARKVEKKPKNREYVYFAMSKDVTKGSDSTRIHEVYKTVFVVTHETFQGSLVNAFPPLRATSKSSIGLAPYNALLSYYALLEGMPDDDIC